MQQRRFTRLTNSLMRGPDAVPGVYGRRFPCYRLDPVVTPAQLTAAVANLNAQVSAALLQVQAATNQLQTVAQQAATTAVGNALNANGIQMIVNQAAKSAANDVMNRLAGEGDVVPNQVVEQIRGAIVCDMLSRLGRKDLEKPADQCAGQ